ncbi:hypothetical protein AB0I82_33810 [Streptomyces sp. NPDC050315]|uniref:hypothetical protein n=1 Tax=Streptomyces sp. NPDC050315 TaxID=3155039 RepID=UPI00341C88BB
MRRLALSIAAAALGVGAMLGAASTASADGWLTAQQCREGGGELAVYQGMTVCLGGEYHRKFVAPETA